MAKSKKSSRKKARRSTKKSATSRKKVSKKATTKKKKSASKKAAKVKQKPSKISREKLVKKTVAKRSVQKFNLLVTYDPNHKGMAEAELKEVLTQIGEKPIVTATEVDGLFKTAVKDARTSAHKITKLVSANPAVFTSTHHYTPVDTWTKSNVKSMQQVVKKAAEGIAENDKWKLGLNKRHWDKLESTQLILKLTEVVDKPNVDLNNPEKIIQVEIIGKDAGVALLAAEDLVDVPRLKANL